MHVVCFRCVIYISHLVFHAALLLQQLELQQLLLLHSLHKHEVCLGLPDFQSRNTGDFYRAMHVAQRAVLLW